MVSLGNGECDTACQVEACFNDVSDCEYCTCDLSLVYNGQCDSECNTSVCGYDGSDCNENYLEISEGDSSGEEDSSEFTNIVMIAASGFVVMVVL